MFIVCIVYCVFVLYSMVLYCVLPVQGAVCCGSMFALLLPTHVRKSCIVLVVLLAQCVVCVSPVDVCTTAHVMSYVRTMVTEVLCVFSMYFKCNLLCGVYDQSSYCFFIFYPFSLVGS